MSGLIWIQTFWHWWIFRKKLILTRNHQTTKKLEKLPSMQRIKVLWELNFPLDLMFFIICLVIYFVVVVEVFCCGLTSLIFISNKPPIPTAASGKIIWVLLNSVICLKPLQTVWIQIMPDKNVGLIWIQTFWHCDMVSLKEFFEKVDFEKKSAKITQHTKN